MNIVHQPFHQFYRAGINGVNLIFNLMRQITLFRLLFFILVFQGMHLQAQRADLKRVASPKLLAMAKNDLLQHQQFYARVTDMNKMRTLLKEHKLDASIILIDSVYRTIELQLPFLTIDSLLVKNGLVDFIDIKRNAREEAIIPGFDPGMNNLARVFSSYPEWNGDGITLSIKEQAFDTTDIDLQARIIKTGKEARQVTTHATRMATMAAGAGNSIESSRGAAWGASIVSNTFDNLVPESPDFYRQYAISVQNHSYGTGIENYYAADAAAYDTTSLQLPYLLHVFSAGNMGEEKPGTGTYSGLPFANLTGSFKMSKNSISVGAVDSFYRPESRSSRGPAYDGRIKPELVAFGQDGSSGAAAIVSGVAATLQQVYAKQHGQLPPSSLVRSILLNSATDLGPEGPDFVTGFGNVNAFTALLALKKNWFHIDSLETGKSAILNIPVPGNLKSLKILLSWTDPPSEPNANKALVNNLDLAVIDPDGREFRPWVLHTSPNADSLSLPATRGLDSLNNNEQVTIPAPKAGTYQVKISAGSLKNSQPYSLSWDVEENQFEWQYPSSSDKILPGNPVLLRWNKGLGGSARLSFTRDGETWEDISMVSLAEPYYYWTPPGGTYIGRLRMQAGANYVYSDSFTVSPRPQIRVGFSCADSFMIHWAKNEVDSFRLYELGPGDPYLLPLGRVPDSLYIGAQQQKKIIAVALVVGGMEGSRSYATDYTIQGTGCYVENFLVDLIADKARVQAWLGTTLNLSSVTLEKWAGTNWKPLASIEKPINTFFQWRDSSLVQGINRYRLKMELPGERSYYSNEEQVFFLNNKNYILYPNPVKRNGTIKMAISDHEGLWFSVYDLVGRKWIDRNLEMEEDELSLLGLPAGIYFYRFTRNGKQEGTGKLVVQ